MHNIKLIAHRGNGPTSHFSGYGRTVPAELEPENTLAAFAKAEREGADGIEFDLRLTADRFPVLIHDDALNLHVEGADRAGSQHGKVSALPYSAIRELNVGKGQRIPLLSEAFSFFAEADTRRAASRQPLLKINIDLKDKSGDLLHIVQRNLQMHGVHGPVRQENLIFCSSDHAQLAAFKRAMPNADVTPSLKTADLFGADNVIMPGWVVAPETPYRATAFAAASRFVAEMPTLAIDAVLSDIYAPLVKFAADRGIGVCATACNVRRYDAEHLDTVIAISRLAPIFLKTDEPALTRKSLMETLDRTAAILRGAHLIVETRELSGTPVAAALAPETLLARRVSKTSRADRPAP